MTQSKEINTYMNRLGSEAKEASLILAQASLEQKNEALSCISEQIESDRDEILSTNNCLLYTSPSPRDRTRSRMPSSA